MVKTASHCPLCITKYSETSQKKTCSVCKEEFCSECCHTKDANDARMVCKMCKFQKCSDLLRTLLQQKHQERFQPEFEQNKDLSQIIQENEKTLRQLKEDLAKKMNKQRFLKFLLFIFNSHSSHSSHSSQSSQ